MWHSVKLYEDFADGHISKADYLAAKEANTNELSETRERMDALTEMLAAASVRAGDENTRNADDSFLQRILSAIDINDEVLSLIHKLVVYDVDRIEIRFAFRDENAARH